MSYTETSTIFIIFTMSYLTTYIHLYTVLGSYIFKFNILWVDVPVCVCLVTFTTSWTVKGPFRTQDLPGGYPTWRVGTEDVTPTLGRKTPGVCVCVRVDFFLVGSVCVRVDFFLVGKGNSFFPFYPTRPKQRYTVMVWEIPTKGPKSPTDLVTPSEQHTTPVPYSTVK